MPQASPEQRAKWGVMPDKAMDFLESRGFRLTHGWTWVKPHGHKITEDEFQAVDFLIAEWDFGGLE